MDRDSIERDLNVTTDMTPATDSARPLIMYELNEVPWAIVDWYISKKPKSNIARIVAGSRNYTSVTSDRGELHPWVTWPTLHRGVDNTVHGIEFLNQDLTTASAFPPLWETAAEAGKKVGVFGSLQSYPVRQDQAYAFYVPDTFAPRPDTYPTEYAALQELNLRQTANDGGIVSSVKIDAGVFSIVTRLLRVGLSFRSIARVIKQLLLERVSSDYKTRRAVLQAPIAFDVFMHAFKRHRPEFCTFFTNHVAGMMHRYWKHALLIEESEQRRDPVRASNIAFAMDIADEQIGALRRLADRSQGHLLILSSMGQAPITRRGGDQVRIHDAGRFVAAAGFAGPYTEQLAMHPDFNFAFNNNEDANVFARSVEKLRYSDGRSITYKVHVCGPTVNIGIAQPAHPKDRDWISQSEHGREISFAEAGLLRFTRDIGTAYHVPEGIMIWYDQHATPDLSRKKIDSREIRPMILAAVGVDDHRFESLCSSKNEFAY